MRSITRPLAGVALVAVFVLAWGTPADRDVVGAQARKPIMATRIFTGTDGQSHAEEVELMEMSFEVAPFSRVIDAVPTVETNCPFGAEIVKVPDGPLCLTVSVFPTMPVTDGSVSVLAVPPVLNVCITYSSARVIV